MHKLKLPGANLLVRLGFYCSYWGRFKHPPVLYNKSHLKAKNRNCMALYSLQNSSHMKRATLSKINVVARVLQLQGEKKGEAVGDASRHFAKTTRLTGWINRRALPEANMTAYLVCTFKQASVDLMKSCNSLCKMQLATAVQNKVRRPGNR